MGHRAIVAYRREDESYDLHYSHWGSEEPLLECRISSETPYAGSAVDPSRFEAVASIERLLAEHLDPCLYESLYVVSREYEVTPYRVCWLEWEGKPSVRTERDRGAIVERSPTCIEREIRIWLRATKTVLYDLVEMSALSRELARSYLEQRVRMEWNGRLYTYTGTPV